MQGTQIEEVRTVTEAGRVLNKCLDCVIMSYAMVESILDVVALIILGGVQQ